jgi:hypothetical protein
MNNAQLYGQALAMLRMTGESPQTQSNAIEKLIDIAQNRLVMLIPDLLTDEQAERAQDLRDAGWGDEAVLSWIETQIPVSYRELFEAAILDIAEEVAAQARSA